MTRHPRRDARPPLRAERVANAHTAAQMRRQLHDWLLLDVPSSVVDDLVPMVYEALANTVEHAYANHAGGTGPVRLEAYRTDGQVLITVSDEGTWRTLTDYDGRRKGRPTMATETTSASPERSVRTVPAFALLVGGSGGIRTHGGQYPHALSRRAP